MRPSRPPLLALATLPLLLACDAGGDAAVAEPRQAPAAAAAAPPGDASPLARRLGSIELPSGFSISLFSDEVPGARSLALGPRGTLIVSTRSEGHVYALPRGEDGRPGEPITIASGLNSPNGVAFLGDDLYVAEISRILRFPGIEGRLETPPSPEVVYDELPTDRGHGWKYLEAGPDGKLYFGIGAPCNICDAGDPYASIARLDPATKELEIFARGVRNTVGFDWNPATGELWFTDNGRDHLGDERPPDELNRAPRAGMHFGYPYCHGGTILDPELGAGKSCADYEAPAANFRAHVAALGMLFYEGAMFPPAYRGDAFVAQHGSWNRSSPIGYRVMHVPIEGSEAGEPEVFASGWLDGGDAWGRPVDVLEMPDGALLVSDDKAGAIYRIAYEGGR